MRDLDIIGDTCFDVLLPPGEMCTMDVVFRPTGAAGARNGALSVMADPGDSFLAPLSGTAGPSTGPCLEHANCCSLSYCEPSVGQCWSIVQ